MRSAEAKATRDRGSVRAWRRVAANAIYCDMLREVFDRQGIGRVEYEEASQLLRVHFLKGSVYEYRAVPRGVFDWLVRTPQPSAYLSRVITPRFEYRRVDGAPAPTDEPLELQLKASLERLKPHD